MVIIDVTRQSFTLEDGSIHPIDPPLEEDLTIEEFKKHYDFAVKVVKSCGNAGSDDPDTEKLE